MKRAVLVLAVVAFAMNPSQAQVPLPASVRDAAGAISASQLQRDVEWIAAADLQGRETPSPGLDKAIESLTARLTAAGVKPLGDAGTYLQRYDIDRFAIDLSASTIRLGDRVFKPGDDFVIRYATQSVQMHAPLAFVGHGAKVPSLNIDPYAGIDTREKILLMWGPAVPKGVSLVTPLEESWSQARAVLFIPRFGVFKDLWAARARPQPTTVFADTRPATASVTPRVWIYAMPSLVEALMAGERIGADELYGRSLAGDPPASFEFDPSKRLTLDISVVRTERFRPANVVAVIEGRDPKLRHEYVTVQAHLDGEGGGAADDNASGVATVLAAAEALMRAPRPRRSIVLLWDTGEERRLWGTRHFIANPSVPLGRIVAHVNVDMVGRSKAAGDTNPANADLTGPNEVYVVGPKAISSDLEAIVTSVNDNFLKLNFNSRYDTWASTWLHPRADHIPFLEKHIPVVFFFTGEHADYHEPTDTPEKLDYAKLTKISQTVFATIWALAESPARPRVDRPWPAKLIR